MPVLLSAQVQQKTGNLTIFSEDGDPFYLVLNGEKQNNVPQTNLRIEELPQPYYNAKIIFADSTVAPVSKNNLMIMSPDNVMMDVTYKIKKDRSGKAKLNYYSAIEVVPDYIPPAGAHVYSYGRPDVVRVSDGRTYTRTTTTTTQAGAGNGVYANVNVNGVGVGVNVAIDDPMMNQTTTTRTTTTTTHHNSNTNNGGHRRNNDDYDDYNQRRRGCNGRPMSSSDFSAAVKTISNTSFDDSKLSTAQSIASNNCLTTDQVVKICGLFGFEETKLKFAKYAYEYTTDQKNYFKVNDVFSFSSSKEELSEFVAK